jgi:hypothetical protein
MATGQNADDRKDDPCENEDDSSTDDFCRWVDPLNTFDRARTVNVCCSHAGHCGDLESYFNTRNSKLDWHGHSNIGGATLYFKKKFSTEKRIQVLRVALQTSCVKRYVKKDSKLGLYVDWTTIPKHTITRLKIDRRPVDERTELRRQQRLLQASLKSLNKVVLKTFDYDKTLETILNVRSDIARHEFNRRPVGARVEDKTTLLVRILNYFEFAPGIKKSLMYAKYDPPGHLYKHEFEVSGWLSIEGKLYVYMTASGARYNIPLNDWVIEALVKRRKLLAVYSPKFILTDDRGKPLRHAGRLALYLRGKTLEK